MQITIEKVAQGGSGLLVDGTWYNKDRFCKSDTSALRAGMTVDLELKEFNGKQYFKSFKVVGSPGGSPSASSYTPAARGGYKSDPKTQLEITRQSSLARATDVYVALLDRDETLKDNPSEFILSLADVFVEYVRSPESPDASAEDDEFPE